MSNGGGFIYAIGIEGRSGVKIGKTTGSVLKRKSTLQCGHPDPLILCASVHVETNLAPLEKAIHRFLEAERQRGEWFACNIDQAQLEALLARGVAWLDAERASLPRQPLSRAGIFPTLGEAIRQARMDQRLQQQELVAMTGISQKYLSQIENDRVDPHFGVVQTIAKALHISLDALVLEQVDRTPKETMGHEVPDEA